MEDKLHLISEAHGLTLNQGKIKMMIIDRAQNNLPHVREVARYEVVDKFVYLGPLITHKQMEDARKKHTEDSVWRVLPLLS